MSYYIDGQLDNAMDTAIDVAVAHGASKINYSNYVFKTVNREKIKQEIMQAAKASPAMKQEIARVFQIANRRIQNIETAGLVSPAVAALGKGDIKRYTKFSMRMGWNELKIEYGKAVAFLRQPTSTASGTRAYNLHLQQAYKLTPEQFNLMAKSLVDKLTSVSDANFVERYLMRYKDFTGELETTARSLSGQIESEAYSEATELQMELEQAATEVADEVADEIQSILDSFNKFKL